MLSPVLDGFTHPALPCPNVRQGTGADVCHEGLLTWHRSCHRRAHATDRLMGRHKDGRYCVSVERASSSGGHQAAGQPWPRHGTVRRRPSVYLSCCVGRGGVPARVIQLTLIYCILHVAGTGNGSKTGASGKPLSLTCVRGSAPRGAGDPPSCMRHKASVQAASHAPHLRAATITPTYCTSPPASSRPCIMTHSARDILACTTRDASHHDAPHGTRPMQAGRMPDN